MATRQRDPDPARRAGEAGFDDGCRSTSVVAARVHRSGDVCGSDSRAAAMITGQRNPELVRACWIGAFADRGRPHSRTRRSVGRRRSRSSAVHRAGSGDGDNMAAVDLGGPVALVVDRLDRHLTDPPLLDRRLRLPAPSVVLALVGSLGGGVDCSVAAVASRIATRYVPPGVMDSCSNSPGGTSRTYAPFCP